MDGFQLRHIDATAALAAVALVICGLWLLFRRWQQRHRANPLTTPAAAAALVGGLVAWGVAAGPELGVTLALASAMLAGLGCVAGNARGAPARARAPVRERVATADVPDAGTWPGALARTLTAGPVGAAAGLAGALLVYGSLHAAPANRLFTAVAVGVILWGVAAVWGCATSRPARSLLVVGAAAAAFGLFVSSIAGQPA